MIPFLNVAGATGYIGSVVTEYIARSGIKTTAVVRDPNGGGNERQAKVAALRHAGVSLLEVSLDDTAQLVQVLKGFDTVISFLQGDAILTYVARRGTSQIVWQARHMAVIDQVCNSKLGCSEMP